MVTKFDDLGNALLHALDEILGGSSNYRPLTPATPTLHVNRSVILTILPDHIYWLVLQCIANYLPERFPGDTDDTVNDMMKLMVEEDRRMKPDLARIDYLMNQTFPDRRRDIVTDGISTSESKTRFPCLFSQDQVKLCELTRAAKFND